MKIWIDRNLCESNLAVCESCFGQLVRTGVPDQPCIIAYRDNGSKTMTVFLHSEDHEQVLVIPRDMRELVALLPWFNRTRELISPVRCESECSGAGALG